MLIVSFPEIKQTLFQSPCNVRNVQNNVKTNHLCYKQGLTFCIQMFIVSFPERKRTLFQRPCNVRNVQNDVKTNHLCYKQGLTLVFKCLSCHSQKESRRCFNVHFMSVTFKMTSKDCPMLVLLSKKLYTKARIRERERKREKKQISFQRPSDIKIKDVL